MKPAPTAYPLQWPLAWKRTPAADRRPAKFGTRRASAPGQYPSLRGITLADAVNRTLAELTRMGIPPGDVVISTNIELRLDGLPRSGQKAAADPGAAVYWRDINETRCLAVDHYTTVEDNLAAIAATLEALRAIERHGGATIMTRAFAGFAALPAPAAAARHWREVLDFAPGADVDLELAQYRYRFLAKTMHPDKPGGSHAAMAELNAAWEQAQEELR